MARPLTLCYSLTDQSFADTKSIGILNVSTALAGRLSSYPGVEGLHVLSNSSLASSLKLAPSARVSTVDWPTKSKPGRILWDQFGVYHAAARSGSEWLFLPKGFASICRRPPVKLAAYVYDTMFDHYDTKHPGYVSGLEHEYFKKCFFASLQYSKIVFTLTEHSRLDILRLAERHRISPPEVVVAGVGFSPDPAPKSDDEREILVVAGKFPHKRSDLAVQYLSKWQAESGHPQTIHWAGSLPENVRPPHFPNWVKHGRLSEQEFRMLFKRCKAVVYFSEHEGFGMPPVEALMVTSAPVFSNIPVMLEVMGTAGFPFANEDYDSFRTALDAALAASSIQLENWAGRLAKRHSWDGVVAKVVSGLVRS